MRRHTYRSRNSQATSITQLHRVRLVADAQRTRLPHFSTARRYTARAVASSECGIVVTRNGQFEEAGEQRMNNVEFRDAWSE